MTSSNDPVFRAREKARSAVHQLVLDEHGQDGFTTEPVFPGARSTERTPLPKLGLQATMRVRNMATQMAGKFVAEMRSSGLSWEDIAHELPGEVSPEDAFEQFAGGGRQSFDQSWLSWHCSTCEQRVMDYGPWNPHPDDQESGHADDCGRHVTAVRRYEQAVR